jgi:uroporphyrin-III C-methyltransferase
VLDFASPDAQRIFAGKRRNEHTLRQEQINGLLVQLAREGKQVVRLKGGDPFVFGRGGEEMQELAAHGVDFEVVPGVTAACGVASYAGIPLTHRDHAQGCLFVTGHLKDGSANLDWEALVRPHQTVVIYMGLNALPDICRQLMAHGAPATRPIAAVQHGTLATQQVLTGTLSDLPAKVAGSGFTSPSLLIVGDVVKLHGTLHWFDPQTAATSVLSPAHLEVPQQLPALNVAASN